MYAKLSAFLYIVSYALVLIVLSKLDKTILILGLFTLTLAYPVSYYVHIASAKVHKTSKEIIATAVGIGSRTWIFLFPLWAVFVYASCERMPNICHNADSSQLFLWAGLVAAALALVVGWWRLRAAVTNTSGTPDDDDPVLLRYSTFVTESGVVNQFISDAGKELINIVADHNARFVIDRKTKAPKDKDKTKLDMLDKEAGTYIFGEIREQIIDGYKLWLAYALQEHGTLSPAYPPRLKALLKLWRKSPISSAEFYMRSPRLKSLIKYAAQNSERRQLQNNNMRHIPDEYAAAMRKSDYRYINIGFAVGEFENDFRTIAAKQNQEQEQTQLLQMIHQTQEQLQHKGVPLLLTGEVGFSLLLHKEITSTDLSHLVFIADRADSSRVIEELENDGYTVKKSKTPVITMTKQDLEAIVFFYEQNAKGDRYFYNPDPTKEPNFSVKGKLEGVTVELASHRFVVITPTFYLQDYNYRVGLQQINDFSLQSEMEQLAHKYYPELTLQSKQFQPLAKKQTK